MDIISMVELLFIGTAFILMVYFALTAIYKIACQIERIHVVHTSDRYRYLVKLHVDHIKPVSKGGKTELSNLRTLCERCNLGKSDKFEDFGMN